MDKSIVRTYSFKTQPKESSLYANMSQEERVDVFLYLMRTAYQFDEWPKMDKTVFSKRKHDQHGKSV